jgi:hypothetical protein
MPSGTHLQSHRFVGLEPAILNAMHDKPRGWCSFQHDID